MQKRNRLLLLIAKHSVLMKHEFHFLESTVLKLQLNSDNTN